MRARGARRWWDVRVITCAVCGLPLSPENAYRCHECGHIVCKDHAVLLPSGRRICTTCARKAAQRRSIKDTVDVVLAIPAVEL